MRRVRTARATAPRMRVDRRESGYLTMTSRCPLPMIPSPRARPVARVRDAPVPGAAHAPRSPPEDHRRSAAATRCAPLAAPRPILCPLPTAATRENGLRGLISPTGNYTFRPFAFPDTLRRAATMDNVFIDVVEPIDPTLLAPSEKELERWWARQNRAGRGTGGGFDTISIGTSGSDRGSDSDASDCGGLTLREAQQLVGKRRADHPGRLDERFGSGMRVKTKLPLSLRPFRQSRRAQFGGRARTPRAPERARWTRRRDLRWTEPPHATRRWISSGRRSGADPRPPRRRSPPRPHRAERATTHLTHHLLERRCRASMNWRRPRVLRVTAGAWTWRRA